jgi:two-component system phosphate regulon sensor histidine kinase PhoR
MTRLPHSSVRLRTCLVVALTLTGFAYAFGARERVILLADGTDGSLVAQHLDDLVRYLTVGAFTCGFAIALAVWSIANSPFQALASTVRAMRRDLGIRTRVRGDEPVGQLGEALDDLAGWLATERSSLEDDRNRLVAILESMLEGVLVTGIDGRIVLANAALREMLLVDRAIVARTPMEAIRVAGLDEILNRAATTDEPSAGEIELQGLRPRRLLVRATRLRGGRRGEEETMRDTGLVAVFNDVTELRRLERVRSDFVANVSHELRTPIAAIVNSTETLEGGALRDATMGRELVAIIGRHSIRLRQLVVDLLELSRLESKEWRFELRAVSVRAAIDGAFEAVAIAARQRETTLVRGVDDASLAVRADPRALEQVLVNLVENAVKYAGQKATVRVDVVVDEREGRVELRVKDNGPGIEPRHLPRLFERFYRVDAGRSRAVGGTGLGLAIVKHLAEAMQGQVSVESAVGAGTTFKVRLPIASPDTRGPAVEAATMRA